MTIRCTGKNDSFGLVLACLPSTDIFRTIYGYDDCGNICGRNNIRAIDLPCSGEDMRYKPYLLLTVTATSLEPLRSCVADCNTSEGYELIFNRCVRFQLRGLGQVPPPQGYLDELWQDVGNFWLELFALCVMALLGSFGMLVLLWCATRVVILAMVASIVGVCFCGTVWLWYTWYHADGRSSSSLLWYAVGSTIATLIVFPLITFVWKKITMVVQLMAEAGEAIRSMLLMLCIPIATITTLLVTFFLAAIFILVIESSGHAKLIDGSVTYEKSTLVLITRWYHLITLAWFLQFVYGCQHLVTAGATTQWFFTRDKSTLKAPVPRSWFALIRYHLGTVALGSLLMSFIQLLQWLQRILLYTSGKSQKLQRLGNACLCCVGCCRGLLDPVCRNAYSLTAMRGLPLCVAGTEAVRLMRVNAANVVGVMPTESVVLLLAKVFVVALVGYTGLELANRRAELYHPYVMAGAACALCFLIADCFLLLYEVTTDTIFLCICKDSEVNDGTSSRPYYMSARLESFVQRGQPDKMDAEQPSGSPR
ncbi:choline transporter-like protein 3 isoform X2 [Culex quinquefasciatus]|uniref:choline transporter-like protein 3 isoform X2 n=1 Tax=Culex quinquefasciatus TaxID=7176 RepID=UPI0018E33EAC|nr:choline transporter-like protein 3 isoform X2 [Culex quinquefasciatus]